MKVVIDTNVIISGLLWQVPPNRLLKLVKEGRFQLCISPSLLKELFNVLNRAKFSHRIVILNTSVEELIAGVSKLLRIFPDKTIPNIIKADPDDDKVLSCALASGAEYIITGDLHLLKLKNWSGILIMTPSRFLDLTVRRKKKGKK